MSDYTQERKKTILDDRKFSLYAKNPEGGNAALKFSMSKMNPRITVWTGVKSDKDNGRCDAKMDLKTFMNFLVVLEEIINNYKTKPIGEAYGVQIAMGFFKDNRVNHISDLHVGVDKEGIIYISVVAKNGNTPIKFPFTTEEYHHMRHRGGEQFSKAEASVVVAKAYLKMLSIVVPILAERFWEEPQQNQSGSRGGNYNGRRNERNERNDDLDDSIDF